MQTGLESHSMGLPVAVYGASRPLPPHHDTAARHAPPSRAARAHWEDYTRQTLRAGRAGQVTAADTRQLPNAHRVTSGHHGTAQHGTAFNQNNIRLK